MTAMFLTFSAMPYRVSSWRIHLAMSIFLPRLESGWHVDQAILAEESRVVVIRLPHVAVRLERARTDDCHVLDLFGDAVQGLVVAHAPPADTVDITAVPDFNKVALCL
jgi:DIM1 family U5 snRNP protein